MRRLQLACKHGILWWLARIAAAVSAISAPFAIAALLDGVIRWNGWIGFVVNLWDESIGKPFASVLRATAAWLHWHAPPEWFSDYMALGLLFYGSLFRAVLVFAEMFKARDRESDGKPEPSLLYAITHRDRVQSRPMTLSDGCSGCLFAPTFVIQLIMAFVAWPGAVLFAIGLPLLINNRTGVGIDKDTLLKGHATFVGLTLAPFGFFLVLWALNTYMPTPAAF